MSSSGSGDVKLQAVPSAAAAASGVNKPNASNLNSARCAQIVTIALGVLLAAAAVYIYVTMAAGTPPPVAPGLATPVAPTVFGLSPMTVTYIAGGAGAALILFAIASCYVCRPEAEKTQAQVATANGARPLPRQPILGANPPPAAGSAPAPVAADEKAAPTPPPAADDQKAPQAAAVATPAPAAAAAAAKPPAPPSKATQVIRGLVDFYGQFGLVEGLSKELFGKQLKTKDSVPFFNALTSVISKTKPDGANPDQEVFSYVLTIAKEVPVPAANSKGYAPTAVAAYKTLRTELGLPA